MGAGLPFTARAMSTVSGAMCSMSEVSVCPAWASSTGVAQGTRATLCRSASSCVTALSKSLDIPAVSVHEDDAACPGGQGTHHFDEHSPQ